MTDEIPLLLELDDEEGFAVPQPPKSIRRLVPILTDLLLSMGQLGRDKARISDGYGPDFYERVAKRAATVRAALKWMHQNGLLAQPVKCKVKSWMSREMLTPQERHGQSVLRNRPTRDMSLRREAFMRGEEFPDKVIYLVVDGPDGQKPQPPYLSREYLNFLRGFELSHD